MNCVFTGRKFGKGANGFICLLATDICHPEGHTGRLSGRYFRHHIVVRKDIWEKGTAASFELHVLVSQALV